MDWPDHVPGLLFVGASLLANRMAPVPDWRPFASKLAPTGVAPVYPVGRIKRNALSAVEHLGG